MMGAPDRAAMASSSVTTRHARIDAQLASWRSTRPGRLMLLGASIALLGGAVLRRREDRPAAGVPARRGDRAVAAGRRRDRRAGALRAAAVAGHRHRRPAGRRLLHAAGDGARPDARQHARGRRRRRPAAPPDRRPDGPGARGRRVRAGRRRRRGDADQRELRGRRRCAWGTSSRATSSARSGGRGGCRTSRARSWSRR